MEEIMINVFNTVGNSFCVEADDGQKVYELIKKALSENKKIKISFQNIEMITSAFLNTAVGQLYRDFNEDLIKRSLSVDQISNDDKVLLKRVTTTAKLFFKDPDRIQNSINEVLGEHHGKSL